MFGLPSCLPATCPCLRAQRLPFSRHVVAELFADRIASDPILRRIAEDEALFIDDESEVESEIDELYAQLRELRAAPASDEREACNQGLLARLRQLQEQEARRIKGLLEERGKLRIGAVDEALRYADKLLGQH